MPLESSPERCGRLRAPFAVAEFRFLLAGEVLSVAGDQLARVALSVLVFDRTRSAALTGLAYALTFAPAVFGGALFGSLGDRFPRRRVMVAADLARAGLMTSAALPGLPLWTLCVVVALTTLLHGPFKGAQQAVLPAVLDADTYAAGMTVRNIAIQAAQLFAFGLGGGVVAGTSARTALALDAATFAGSALLLRVGLRPRGAARADRVPFVTAMREGAAFVFRDPALRTLTALLWLAGFYVVPEALAAPYGAALGGGAVAVGALMASDPAGSIIGGFAFGTWLPTALARRLLGLFGVAAGLPLLGFVFHLPLPVAMTMYAVSGAAATAYTIHGVAEFMQRLPDAMRAQGSGLMGAGLVTVQGLGALLAGVVADKIGAAHTITLAGLAGVASAVPIANAWAKARHSPTGFIASEIAVRHSTTPPCNSTPHSRVLGEAK